MNERADGLGDVFVVGARGVALEEVGASLVTGCNL